MVTNDNEILDQNTQEISQEKSLLIVAYKEAQDKLISRIDKYDIPIGESNGVMLTQGGMTPEDARRVIDNVKKFKTDSARHSANTEKVVLHKKIFEDYCQEIKAFSINASTNGKALVPLEVIKTTNDIYGEINEKKGEKSKIPFLLSYFSIVIFLASGFFTALLSYFFDFHRSELIYAFISLALGGWLLFFVIRHNHFIKPINNEIANLRKLIYVGENYIGDNDYIGDINNQNVLAKLCFDKNTKSAPALLQITLVRSGLEFFKKALNKFTIEAIKNNSSPKYLLTETNQYNLVGSHLRIKDNVTWYYEVPNTDVVVVSNLKCLKKSFFIKGDFEVTYENFNVFLR